MIVNQWVPAAHAGDAVGDHARALRGLLRSWGHESDIYAIDIDDSLAGDVRPWDHAGSRGGDVTILHFATASAMTDGFGRLPGTKVLHYHNVTPAHFFAGFDEDHLERVEQCPCRDHSRTTRDGREPEAVAEMVYRFVAVSV